MKNLVILGSGPAGLTAAVYAARAGLAPLVLDGPAPGGPLVNTPEIENIPGFPEGIAGFEFVERLRRQAEKFDAAFQGNAVAEFIPQLKGGALLVLDNGDELQADAVIIATGAGHRRLGLPNEDALLGKGLSYCATCDGFFYRGKPIAVVGGGDSAMEEALFLTRFASRVTLIHRRDEFRASHILAERVKAKREIDILWNTVVTELTTDADGRLTALQLRNVQTNAVTTLDTAALFVAIGLVPASEPFSNSIPVDDNGYLIADGVHTNLPGVFVAGDVADSRYRQAVTAAAAGCQAAIEAGHYLHS